MGANVPRTDAARHRRPHGSIQKEDFAEFGVNYTGATKWFHIMQKKNLLIKDEHTSAHTRSSEHYRAVRFGGVAAGTVSGSSESQVTARAGRH